MGLESHGLEKMTAEEYKELGYKYRPEVFDMNTLKFKDTSKNNGGETDYYAIDAKWNTFQDVIEDRKMNYAQGNIFKVACTFNIGRHKATDYERELNKIIFFAQRELNKIRG